MKFRNIYVFKFVILYGTTHGLNLSYVNWIICGTPVEKIKRIECVKLIFKPVDRKKRIAKRKKDSFDLAIGVPQMIQFTYDKLRPLLSRSVQYNKFEYINYKNRFKL